MDRTEIINIVADHIGAENYLEIGVYVPARHFDLVKVKYKVGVDPAAPEREDMARIPSDEFFAKRQPAKTWSWDLIFIDGDHTYAQCARDLVNAWKHLTPGGVIVMHDINPENAEKCTKKKPAGGAPWSGECWKVFVEQRRLDGRIGVCVPVDHGVGILQARKTKGLGGREKLTFAALDQNRGRLMNFITPTAAAICAAVDPLPAPKSKKGKS